MDFIDDDEQPNKRLQTTKLTERPRAQLLEMQEEDDEGVPEVEHGSLDDDDRIQAIPTNSTDALQLSEPPSRPAHGGEHVEPGPGPGPCLVQPKSRQVAEMADLDTLPEILGAWLFEGMQASSVRLAEEEVDRQQGKVPRRLTDAVRLYLAPAEGEDFKLELALGFEMGLKLLRKAFHKSDFSQPG